MTMTLEISEEMEHRLLAEAERRQISPEKVLLGLAEKYLSSDETPDEGELHRQRVKQAGDYVEQKNAELYKRLA